MLASVVITSFNYEPYVGASIDSALAQTHPETEVIVVDDGSTDGSRRVVAGYGERVRAVLKQNGGQASALNAGFRASRGEVVVFLDSDDTLAPHAVARAVDVLSDPAVAKTHAPLFEVDERGARTGRLVPRAPLARGDLSEAVRRGGPTSYVWPPTSGNAWARRVLERVLPMPEEDFRVCPDLYLSALAPLFGRVESLRDPQGSWRAHARNATWRDTFAERRAASLRQLERCFAAIRDACEERGLVADPEEMKRNSWWQIDLAAAELAALLSPGESFILVDQDEWNKEIVPHGRPLPFLEKDGAYWGPPADDAAAIRELERQRERGARHIVFGWPHLWWLDHYALLHRHLRSRYRCVLENERLVVFDLAGGKS